MGTPYQVEGYSESSWEAAVARIEGARETVEDLRSRYTREELLDMLKRGEPMVRRVIAEPETPSPAEPSTPPGYSESALEQRRHEAPGT